MSVATSSSNITHFVCGRCSTVLYCSEVEVWLDYRGRPDTGYGWCFHVETEHGGPHAVFDRMPGADSMHNCNGEMRSSGGRQQ